MEHQPDTLTLADAVGVLRRRLPLIALCAAVVAAAAYAYSAQQQKQYTASASLVFSTNPLSQQIAGLPPASTGNLLAQQASNLELVRLGDMAARTASSLGHGLTEQKVAAALSIAGQGESSVVGVTATAASPELAAAIANTYSEDFVAEQQASNSGYFRSALALVNRQLSHLTRAERFGPAGVALQNRAQTLILLSHLRYGNVQLAQHAIAPAGPSAPRISRNALLGLLVGLLIGVGLAFALERLDDRVRRPEELAQIYGVPLLGAVPGARRSLLRRTPTAAATTHAFGLIRARLRLAGPRSERQVILLLAAEAGDATDATAVGLAAAEARAGARVLLVKASLSPGSIAQGLGLPAGPGLVDVLAGRRSLAEAIRSLDLSVGAGVQGRLDALAAGAELVQDPAALLESDAMGALLERARIAYDTIFLVSRASADGPDALALLGRVDGVIVTGAPGRARRQAAEQLHRLLQGTGVAVLGVVAAPVELERTTLGVSGAAAAVPPAGPAANGTLTPPGRVTAGV